MKKILILVCAVLLPLTVSFAQSNNITRQLGFWEFATSNGLEGNMVLTNGSCQYTITSAHLTTSASCQIVWDAKLNLLTILGTRPNSAYSVPEYKPAQPAGSGSYQITGGIGLPLFTFILKKMSRSRMSGHMMGAGNHVSVRMRRH